MAVPALLRSRLLVVLQLAVAFWLAATSGCLGHAVPERPPLASTDLFPPETRPCYSPRALCPGPPPLLHSSPPQLPPPPPLLSPPPPPAVAPPPLPAPGHRFPPRCFGPLCPPHRPPVCTRKYGCGDHGSPP
ncbi:hypothetical protein BS78_05G175100 [Paspalum vaginatum]|nr:hypothetical protein BS78_05G175100 [Paspalum vaginatum]